MKIRKLYYMMALVLPIAFSSCEDYLDKAVSVCGRYSQSGYRWNEQLELGR